MYDKKTLVVIIILLIIFLPMAIIGTYRHFTNNEDVVIDDNPDKVVAIVARRLEKGQCFSTPYMGCREFSCAFGRWPEEKAIPAIDDSKDFGIMLYDLDYSDPSNIRPMYFHAVMDQGVIDVGNAEVLR